MCVLSQGKDSVEKGDQKAALEEFTSSAKEANRMHLPYGGDSSDYLCRGSTLSTGIEA